MNKPAWFIEIDQPLVLMILRVWKTSSSSQLIKYQCAIIASSSVTYIHSPIYLVFSFFTCPFFFFSSFLLLLFNIPNRFDLKTRVNNLKKMINRSEEESPKFDQVYHQYVQFINDSYIVSPLSILLLAISHVVILTDLLVKLSPDNNLVKEITYFGISPMLLEVNLSSKSFALFVNIVIIMMLTAPLVSILTIVYYCYWGVGCQNGVLKQKFQKSFIGSWIRAYYINYSYIFLPVFVSYATKIINEGTSDKIFGVGILILSIFNTLIIEYHLLELGNNEAKCKNLVPVNFPYHLIDSTFVIIVLICINLTSGAASQIIGFLFICLRVVLSFYVPFYNQYNQKYYKVIVVASIIASLGLLISFYNIDRNYNLFLILILVAYLLFSYSSKEQVPVWQEVTMEQNNGENLQNIKEGLSKKGLFVKTFRSLIFLGRQNFSQRTLLEIEIMKSKCYTIQQIFRGGTKVCGSLDIIKFQEKVVKFMKNFLNSCELSISILKFMQSKEGKKQTLAKFVEELVVILTQNKKVIRQLFQLNEYSSEVKFLLLKTYGMLYNDANFLKETQKWMNESLLIQNQKQLKQNLFSDKSVSVFINVLEELGKVVKISKNLPSVLGYEPANLLGLSINEIIPISVKQYHDENLLDFIDRFSSKQAKTKQMLTFYAYNSEFHLQQINVRYSWIMNQFSAFHMAGIIERVDSDTHVILTDEYGNLEGWTKALGGQQLNLDCISISERQKYNVMPLFPTLIKYMDSLGVVVRTLFFKTSKVRQGQLVIVDSHNKQNVEMVQKKALQSFKQLLKEEEIVGAFFAEIEFVRVSLCQGRAKLRKITIKEYEPIQNLSQILTLIEKSSTLSSIAKTDRSLVSYSQLQKDTQKQDMSIFSEEGRGGRRVDSNFSLEPQGQNYFHYDVLTFGQFNVSKTALEITSVCQSSARRRKDEQGVSSSQDSSYSPNLKKNGTLMWYVFLITAAFLVLLILNIVDVMEAGKSFEKESKRVVSRNKAASIYLKSIFNPNATYVDRFANGSLLQNLQYLYKRDFNYTTFLGDVMNQNLYYMFNTQVPSTLQRLVNNPITYTSTTVDITPLTNADYYTQVTNNYLGVVRQYHNKFSDALNVWREKIDTIQRNFFIRFGFLCVSLLLYCLLLILMYYRERRHKQTLQAFFKFQKEDLEKKINGIGTLVRQMQVQAAEMNLLKQFSEIIKKDEITNMEFGLVKNIHDVRIKFDHDEETESKIQKKKYYCAVGGLIIFIIFMMVFMIVHSVINTKALSYYRNTPLEIDNAAKLIVQPNYLLADIYQSLPSDIKLQYDNLVNDVLGTPLVNIPELYPFLGNVPCTTCQFMYPVLTTNYKTFYSTFQQRAVQIKMSNATNKTVIQDMFYAADYVIEQITPILLTSSYSYLDTSVVIYVISLIILCITIWIGTNSVNKEIQKLQTFLLFFSEETITKNKHMNRLFTNFQ